MTKDTFAAAHATLLICLLRLSDLMTLIILLVIAKMMEQKCCFLQIDERQLLVIWGNGKIPVYSYHFLIDRHPCTPNTPCNILNLNSQNFITCSLISLLLPITFSSIMVGTNIKLGTQIFRRYNFIADEYCPKTDFTLGTIYKICLSLIINVSIIKQEKFFFCCFAFIIPPPRFPRRKNLLKKLIFLFSL